MANTINLGLDTVSTIKIGADNVDAVYVGDVLVYSGGTPPTPPTPTLEWVSFNRGDTIPSGNVYGFSGDSQTVGFISYNILEIGSDTNNCVTFGHGAPTRAPQFMAYFYLVSSGSTSMIESWDSGNESFIFSDYSSQGVKEYYYEDGTKTVPFDCKLYITPPPTLQWVTFTNEVPQTDPSGLYQIYGIKFNSSDLDSVGDSINIYNENTETSAKFIGCGRGRIDFISWDGCTYQSSMSEDIELDLTNGYEDSCGETTQPPYYLDTISSVALENMTYQLLIYQ